MTQIVTLARYIPTNEIIHVELAFNGLACNCECVKCEEKLEAIQGVVYTWHFRHNKNKICMGGHETALHQLAKQILVEHSQIATQERGIIAYTAAVAEKKIDQRRPDVTATHNNNPIYFEVYVSNAVDVRKTRFFIDGRLRSLEIDLSRCTRIATPQEIKKLVLDVTYNKRIIFWQDEQIAEALRPNDEVQIGDEIQLEKKNPDKKEGFWDFIPWAVAVVLFLKWISRR